MLAFVLAVVLREPNQLPADAVEKDEEALDATEALEAEVLADVVALAAEHFLLVEGHEVVESHQALAAPSAVVSTLLLLIAEEQVAYLPQPLVDLLVVLLDCRLESQLLPENVEVLGRERDAAGAQGVELDELEPLRDLVTVRIKPTDDFGVWVCLQVGPL